MFVTEKITSRNFAQFKVLQGDFVSKIHGVLRHMKYHVGNPIEK